MTTLKQLELAIVSGRIKGKVSCKSLDWDERNP